MKTFIGARLPTPLHLEFTLRADSGFPGGKTGLIKEALRAYFEANPLIGYQLEELASLLKISENVVISN